MITKSFFVVVVILLFASPAFTQFGQSNNNRLTDLAARLSRESGDFRAKTTALTQAPSATTEPTSRLSWSRNSL